MSKAVNSVFGNDTMKTKGYEKDIVNYLNNYNTQHVDNTLNNLSGYANNASQNIGDKMGNYTFNVNASDDARKRAEEAYYNSYMDRLNPQFKTQTGDLETRLANQGLSVGSEAYQRSMGDLLTKQNDATSQAAYNSVLSGQNAFSQSLQDQINAGTFGNNSQQAYINQMLSALAGQQNGYGKALDQYAIQNGIDVRKQNAAASGWANMGNVAGTGAKAFGMGGF